MGKIVYTCPYVPAEWIAAHGPHPSRVMPEFSGSAFSPAGREGVCPYVRGFVAEVTKNKQAAGVVVTTACDQMRRAFDIITRKCELPSFLMNVPNTWENAAALALYTDELRRLGRFLARQGGEAPSHDRLMKWLARLFSPRENLCPRGSLPKRWPHSVWRENLHRALNAIRNTHYAIREVCLWRLSAVLL